MTGVKRTIRCFSFHDNVHKQLSALLCVASADSRVNFEHKVLLLLEVRDGVEHVTHGEYGAAVRPSVLHVRRALLGVVEQHATWK